MYSNMYDITIRAITYMDTLKYQETYRAANMSQAYDMFLKDHPDTKHIGIIHHLECEKSQV